MKKLLVVLLIFCTFGFSESRSKNISITVVPAITDHSVTLTWNYDPSATVTFNVYRQQAGDTAYTKIASAFTTKTYVDEDVVSSITYSYYVTASNSDAESTQSNVVVATIPTP
jgi:fibronectin type 3 domain-containing protein